MTTDNKKNLAEISKPTLRSYLTKANKSMSSRKKDSLGRTQMERIPTRQAGVHKAVQRLIGRHDAKTGTQAYTAEELTDKTVRSNDKVKVARMIADMLGVEDAESMTPEAAVNAGLRKIKSKKLTPELLGIVKKMLHLAQETGVKVDPTLIPKAVSESATYPDYDLDDEDFEVDIDDGEQEPEENNTEDEPENQPSNTSVHVLDMMKQRAENDPHTQVGHGLGHHIHDMTKRHLRLKYTSESVEQQNTDQWSDEMLDKIAGEIDHEDDILDLYSNDELHFVDLDTDETHPVSEESVDEEALVEVLSRAARLRAGLRFARSAPRRAARLKIVLKRHSDIKTLTKRAHRLAILTLKQKIMKKPVSQMSVAEKEHVEGMLATMKPVITRLAIRLIPKVAKIEHDRLSHETATKQG